MKPFWQMTRDEYHKYCRKLYLGLPALPWDEVKEGDLVILRNEPKGYVITRVPPKRGYVLCHNVLDAEKKEVRLSRQNYGDKFARPSAPFKRIMHQQHEEIVKKAISAGHPVPPRVKYDHLFLVTPPPAHWGESETWGSMRSDARNYFGRLNEWRFLKDRDEGLGWEYRHIQKWIDEKKGRITELEQTLKSLEDGTYDPTQFLPKALASNIESTKGYIKSRQRDLEIFEYLKRHIENTLMAEPEYRSRAVA